MECQQCAEAVPVRTRRAAAAIVPACHQQQSQTDVAVGDDEDVGGVADHQRLLLAPSWGSYPYSSFRDLAWHTGQKTSLEDRKASYASAFVLPPSFLAYLDRVVFAVAAAAAVEVCYYSHSQPRLELHF